MAKSRGSFQLMLCAVCCVLFASRLSADIPHLIRYQGQAVDTNGVPLEGPYTLTFRLYNAATGGTKIWEEQQVNVPLTGGHFSVLLGQVTPLTSMDWSQACWLSVQVNTEPELSPRQQITSVPLALRARMAEQLTVPITTSTITDDANKLVPAGAVILWTGASCPTGYTRVSALDGALLKASASAGGPTAAGLSDLPAHSHGVGSYAIPNHVHNLWTDANTTALSPRNGIAGDYTYSATWKSILMQSSEGGPITGTSAAIGSGTVATVLLCQKN